VPAAVQLAAAAAAVGHPEATAAAVVPAATAALTATAAAGAGPAVVEGPGAQVVAWAESHGARVSRKVAFLQPGPHGDRCCMAASDIEETENLVALPRALAFETPPAQPLGVPPDLVALLLRVAEHEEVDRPAGRSLAVALMLHYERMKGDASEFAPYIDALPACFPTMPSWEAAGAGEGGDHAAEEGADAAELYRGTGVERLVEAGAALSGPEGVAMMREAIARLDQEGMFWHHALRSDDDSVLRWAAAAVQSRAHSSKRGATALVPLADSFNHSATNPNIELCERGDGFYVRALRPIKSGEELLLSYGPFSNAELLFNAGFTCERNPNDCLLLSRKDLVAAVGERWRARGEEAPKDLAARCELLTAGLPVPRLTAAAPLLGGAVPAEVVSALAGLSLDAETWREASLRAEASGKLVGIRERWASGGTAAEQLRGEVLSTLQVLVDGRLAPRYRTPLAEDRARLEAASAALASSPEGACDAVTVRQLRRLNILRARIGERRVLESLGATLAARLRPRPAEVPLPEAKRPRVQLGSSPTADASASVSCSPHDSAP